MFINIMLLMGAFLYMRNAIDTKAIMMIIVLSLIIHINLSTSARMEGFGSSEEETTDYEALQNLASMVADGTLKVTNLEVSGTSSFTGDMVADGTVKATDLEVSGTSSFTGDMETGNVTSSGKVSADSMGSKYYGVKPVSVYNMYGMKNDSEGYIGGICTTDVSANEIGIVGDQLVAKNWTSGTYIPLK